MYWKIIMANSTNTKIMKDCRAIHQRALSHTPRSTISCLSPPLPKPVAFAALSR